MMYDRQTFLQFKLNNNNYCAIQHFATSFQFIPSYPCPVVKYMHKLSHPTDI